MLIWSTTGRGKANNAHMYCCPLQLNLMGFLYSNRTLLFSVLFTRYGYNGIVFGRPDLFRLLDSHIPQGKILMGKRVLSTSQTEEGVMVRCSDGSTYHGDVLVGADGAYSSIRQCMHKSLKEKGMLPKSDSEKLKFDQHCVVGITNELNPERFPILKEDPCEVYGIIGKKRPYTVRLLEVAVQCPFYRSKRAFILGILFFRGKRCSHGKKGSTCKKRERGHSSVARTPRGYSSSSVPCFDSVNWSVGMFMQH